MNDIYKTPLLTSWPDPFSGESLKECFGVKEKKLKRKTKKEMKSPSPLSYFLNLFSTSY